MMGVGAKRAIGLYRSCAPRHEEGKSVVSSRSDNFLTCFGQEYEKLLSHRRTIGDINPEELRDALFQKRIKPEKYDSYDDRVRGFAEEILQNMARRFGYSSESALDTVLFGLRKKIIDFSEIISVSSGDGRNPSPLGEEKIVVLWSRASLQARSAHENGPKSAHRLDTEIS